MTGNQAFRTESANTYQELLALLRTPHDLPTLVINTSLCDQRTFRDMVQKAQAITTDHDGTISAGNQWATMRAHCMNDEAAAEDWRDAADYFSGKNRSDEKDAAFIFRSVERLVRSELTWPALLVATRHCPVRVGAKSLLVQFDPEHIHIASFGLADYIRMWLQLNQFLDASQYNVSALELTWNGTDGNKTNLLDDFKASTVVTDGTKGASHLAFLQRVGVNPDKALVLGDSPNDMLGMGRHSPSIMVIPRAEALAAKEAKMREEHRASGLKAAFGVTQAFLLSDSLKPLSDIRLSV